MTQPRDLRILLYAGAAVPVLVGLLVGLFPGLKGGAAGSPVLSVVLVACCTGLPLGLLFLGFKDLWTESLMVKRLGYVCFMLVCAPVAFLLSGLLLFDGWAPLVLFFAWTAFAALSWRIYGRLHGLARILPALLCACVAALGLCGLSCGLVWYVDACRMRSRECRGYAQQEQDRIRRDTLRDPLLDRGLKKCASPLYRLCLSDPEPHRAWVSRRTRPHILAWD
ncbi:MAG: hypothetical protein WC728_08395 [Elusimicrobiota bacterium]